MVKTANARYRFPRRVTPYANTLRRSARIAAQKLKNYFPPAAAAGAVAMQYSGKGVSFGKTKEKKRKRNNQVVRVVDFQNTRGYLYRKGSEKTLKRWYKDGIRLRWKYTDSQTYTSANGLQAVNILPVTLFQRSDIDTITDKIVAAVPTGLPSVTVEYGLKKVTHTIQMKNQTNDEIEVWLYFCMAKKDIPTGGLTPASAWTTGINDQTGTAGTPFDFPYAEPRESELFKESYTVKSGKYAIA